LWPWATRVRRVVLVNSHDNVIDMVALPMLTDTLMSLMSRSSHRCRHRRYPAACRQRQLGGQPDHNPQYTSSNCPANTSTGSNGSSDSESLIAKFNTQLIATCSSAGTWCTAWHDIWPTGATATYRRKAGIQLGGPGQHQSQIVSSVITPLRARLHS
jgi:hypothetical protein